MIARVYSPCDTVATTDETVADCERMLRSLNEQQNPANDPKTPANKIHNDFRKIISNLRIFTTITPRALGRTQIPAGGSGHSNGIPDSSMRIDQVKPAESRNQVREPKVAREPLPQNRESAPDAHAGTVPVTTRSLEPPIRQAVALPAPIMPRPARAQARIDAEATPSLATTMSSPAEGVHPALPLLNKIWAEIFGDLTEAEAIPTFEGSHPVQFIPLGTLSDSADGSPARDSFTEDVKVHHPTHEVAWFESQGKVRSTGDPLGTTKKGMYFGWQQKDLDYEYQRPVHFNPENPMEGDEIRAQVQAFKGLPLSAESGRQQPKGALLVINGPGFYGDPNWRSSDGGPNKPGEHLMVLQAEFQGTQEEERAGKKVEVNKVRFTLTRYKSRIKGFPLGRINVPVDVKAGPIDADIGIDLLSEKSDFFEVDLNTEAGSRAYELLLAMQGKTVSDMAKENKKQQKKGAPSNGVERVNGGSLHQRKFKLDRFARTLLDISPQTTLGEVSIQRRSLSPTISRDDQFHRSPPAAVNPWRLFKVKPSQKPAQRSIRVTDLLTGPIPIRGEVGFSGGGMIRATVLTPVDISPGSLESVDTVTAEAAGAKIAAKLLAKGPAGWGKIDPPPPPGTEITIQEVGNLRTFFARIQAGLRQKLGLDTELQASVGVDSTPSDPWGYLGDHISEHAMVFKWTSGGKISVKRRTMKQTANRQQLTLDLGLDANTSKIGREVIDEPSVGLEFFRGTTGISVGKVITQNVLKLFKVEGRYVTHASADRQEDETVYSEIDPSTKEGVRKLDRIWSLDPRRDFKQDWLVKNKSTTKRDIGYDASFQLGPFDAQSLFIESKTKGKLETAEGGLLKYHLLSAQKSSSLLSKYFFPETKIDFLGSGAISNLGAEPKSQAPQSQVYQEIKYEVEDPRTDVEDIDPLVDLLFILGGELEKDKINREANLPFEPYQDPPLRLIKGWLGIFSDYGRSQQDVRYYIREKGLETLAQAPYEKVVQTFSKVLNYSHPDLLKLGLPGDGMSPPPWMSESYVHEENNAWEKYFIAWRDATWWERLTLKRSDLEDAYGKEFPGRSLDTDAEAFLMADQVARVLENWNVEDLQNFDHFDTFLAQTGASKICLGVWRL
ncbi:MAG: hypothetical protein R3C68_05830 [Myxococcota bacterium]